jgi:hypothetical protein
MVRTTRLLLTAALAAVVLTVPAGLAGAHAERPTVFPDGTGVVPDYRTDGPYLTVCRPDSGERIAALPAEARGRNQALLAECRKNGFQYLQAAVDAVTEPGTRILLLPGVYREEPSLAPLTAECQQVAEMEEPPSYEQQQACPHAQNLVAILGDGPDEDGRCDGPLCRLQVEGTGARPEDVVVDAQFSRLNVIRADRADGVYFANFAVQRGTFNALYILETDGFVIDRMLGRWNDEYAFLTFAVDHGLYTDCEAHGNGDSGIYPGSASDLHGVRHAVEIRRCDSHHNTLGVSGTAGNSLWIHDNDFHHNSAGISFDSFFPNHPGLPQDSSIVENNRLWSNNVNYYGYWADGTCDRPSAERGYENGVVCPVVPVPVGTGILLAGGNNNVYRGNQMWDNWRYGGMQLSVPAAVRRETDPTRQLDTSHFNRWLTNTMGTAPDGSRAANGTDFWWDEGGTGNCWQANTAGSAQVTSDPGELPDCGEPALFRPSNPVKLATLVPCALWSQENHHPAGCDWVVTPPRPAQG